MNSSWSNSDNRAGRCAEVDEHFSVPTGQFCAGEVELTTHLANNSVRLRIKMEFSPKF